MVLVQETVTESEDSPERPVAGLRGSVEIVAWRVRGGQRALATGASRVSPPVGVFLCLGGAERRSGGPRSSSELAWPSPRGHTGSRRVTRAEAGVLSTLQRAGWPCSRRQWGPLRADGAGPERTPVASRGHVWAELVSGESLGTRCSQGVKVCGPSVPRPLQQRHSLAPGLCGGAW